jgi:endoglucanase
MKETDFLDLAQQIMPLPTAPFHEGSVAEAIRQFADQIDSLSISSDSFGNLHLLYDGLAPRSRRPPALVLTAHMDHPGLAFAGRTSQRDLLFEKLGGVQPDFARGARVRIYTVDRTSDSEFLKGKITAYIEDPKDSAHFRVRMDELSEAEAVGPGSFAMWDLEPFELRGRLLRGRACDDLAGVTVALSVLRELDHLNAPLRVGLLLTRAEEVGFAGMIAAAVEKHLDRRAIYLNIECSSCTAGAPLGDGPVIRVGDRSWIFDSEVTAGLCSIAEELSREPTSGDSPFRYQRRLMDGGMCEATALARAGVRTGAVALPLSNYHNHGKKRLRPEAVDLDDALSLSRLLVAAITRSGGLTGCSRAAGRKVDQSMRARYRRYAARLRKTS